MSFLIKLFIYVALAKSAINMCNGMWLCFLLAVIAVNFFVILCLLVDVCSFNHLQASFSGPKMAARSTQDR